MTDQRTYTRNSNVVVRSVAGETLLVPIRGRLADLQHLFVLEGVGDLVWERLDGAHDLSDIAAEIAAECKASVDEVEADCHLFIEALLEEELISV